MTALAGFIAAALGIVAVAALVLRRVHRHALNRIERLERHLIDVKRLAWVARLAAELREAGSSPALPLACPSQIGEDVLLLDIFDGSRTGFFVEAGAHDGFTHSATWILEAIGWTGLLVEPNPAAAAKCRAARPGSRVVHAALTTHAAPASVEFVLVDEGRPREQLSYVPSLAQRGNLPPAHAPAETRRTSVPAARLSDLLDEAGATTLDVLVLDVEGAELPALRGLDLARHRPRVCLIEDGSRPSDRLVCAHLKDHGYVHIGRWRFNTLYVRDDEPGLIARARAAL